MTREFTSTQAKRESVPLLMGLTGPSGSGKTNSALRVATGMQRVTGGNIFFIDTEHRRGLHYADEFDFQHVEMNEPFSPLDYLAAIESCEKQGAKILIVDSFSHCHEGPGGVLEMHESEVNRLAGNNASYARREKMNFPAWSKPKKQHQMLVSAILRLGVNAIFCFRAKQKMLMPKKGSGDKEMIHLGWQPIVTDRFEYEMTISVLLYPGAEGVPNWSPDERGENIMIKRYAKLKHIFPEGEPLSEETGEALARWAAGKGDTKSKAENRDSEDRLKAGLDWVQRASSSAELKATMADIKDELIPHINQADVHVLRDAASLKFAALKASEADPSDTRDESSNTGHSTGSAVGRTAEQLDDRRGFLNPTDPIVEGGGSVSSPAPSDAPEVDPDTGEVIPDEIGEGD